VAGGEVSKSACLTVQNCNDGKRSEFSGCFQPSLAATDDKDIDRLARGIKARVEHAIDDHSVYAVTLSRQRCIQHAGGGQDFVNSRLDGFRSVFQKDRCQMTPSGNCRCKRRVIPETLPI